MYNSDIPAQIKFINDAVNAAPRGLKVFACSEPTLGALTQVKFIGKYTPRIVKNITQYPSDYSLIATRGTCGFDIIDTRTLPLDLAGQLLTRSKEWMFPNRYDNDFFLAVIKNHRTIDHFHNGMKLEYCCIDMDDAHLLQSKRDDYEF